MLIPEAEQRDFLVYAFRYTLGRRTYAPHTVIQVLKSAWGELSEGDKNLYRREIRNAINDGMAGADFDAKAWAEILELK